MDVLADGLVDLAIKLPLTERVRVVRDSTGQLLLEHLPEPQTEFEHADTLAGGVLVANGQVIATLPAITG